MRTFSAAAAVGLIGCVSTVLSQAQEPVRVTVDNFRRAESDSYFGRFVKDGGFGKFHHERELAAIDHQTVIRLNRDTLYSFGVFDLDAAPVTITLPDAGKRYMAMQVINEDHYATDVFYAPGTHTLTSDQAGTRYVALAIRTFVNPNDQADVRQVHALQDGIKVEQESSGKFEVTEWDQASLKQIREALLAVVTANGGLESTKMFGRKGEVDPVQHLLGTAAGWGGNPRYAALYAGASPRENDGKTAYRMTVKDVPVDGFWSVSVYDEGGYFEKNPENAYTVNDVTARPNADGSVTIHFGGDRTAPNYLPITPGWNYLLRMYRPRKEILDGAWKLPEAEPVR
ncbi:DUF1214 domain-containing protein [Paludisphaera mucosa]|uniref:DUF1214 domain-containing protein n=1 Tax=Paludisphaera mucosa TaxID=3030827 RepID=A0ABT6FE50_9BACT|nr:DUF1214 domain-containing protein [Paludisphaera mucosa]MDG3005650.1 DUF1214 domain-containing protein [Paludisphaera mucosa]